MHAIVEQLLRQRGIVDFEKFFNPALSGLAAPEDLPGIVEAADIILAALPERRKIVVFGDYDCDGVSATAIMVRVLRALGGEVSPFIPSRLDEGYGMSDASVARMLRDNPGVSLVVTVDNGINAVEHIAALKEKGVAVVVTDHHLPGDILPAADALVNPRVAAPDSLRDLCGAGVAFMLANRLVNEARRRGLYTGPNVGGPLLVLAGLATITDVMPVLGQNRILVAEALTRFQACAPIGLRELHHRAARNGAARLTSKDFGFLLGPRINAAGRLASADQALELVTEDDRDITRELAIIVDGFNIERKAIEQRDTDEAERQLVPGAPAQVLHLPNGHPGIAGIVAARLMEKMDSPVPVCVITGDHGSARSPGELNIRDAFVACADCLSRFGGHAAAGGFSVKPGRIDEFRQRLCEYFAAQPASQPRSETAVDLYLVPSDISLVLADDLQRMEPFGEGNREPVFGLKNVFISDARPMGADGKHLALVISPSAGRVPAAERLRAIWWGRGELVEELRALAAQPHDITFSIAISDYVERHVELRLISITRSANPPA